MVSDGAGKNPPGPRAVGSLYHHRPLVVHPLCPVPHRFFAAMLYSTSFLIITPAFPGAMITLGCFRLCEPVARGPAILQPGEKSFTVLSATTTTLCRYTATVCYS